MAEPRHDRGSERKSRIERLLDLATELFDVATAAFVMAAPDGFRVAAIVGSDSQRSEAIASAKQLFEVLLAPAPGSAGHGGAAAGVLEDVAVDRGYVGSAPVISADGRRLGALCLLDPRRRTLLSTLQRRLFAEFGGLAASSLDDPPAPTFCARAPEESGALLRDLADADADAIALFDSEGRCLVRNGRFESLLISRPGAALPDVPAAAGCEAAWLSRRLAREREPVGVYRAALADGTWLCVEERRTPDGYSLIGRLEHRRAAPAREGDRDRAD